MRSFLVLSEKGVRTWGVPTPQKKKPLERERTTRTIPYQYPSSLKQKRCCSLARRGKISFSMDVGLKGILSMTLSFKIYSPVQKQRNLATILRICCGATTTTTTTIDHRSTDRVLRKLGEKEEEEKQLREESLNK